MICTFCGTEFEAKRKTAKYCSTKCRVYDARTGPTKVGVRLKSLPKDVTPKQVLQAIKPQDEKAFDFCKHEQVKGFCKKGCR